MHQKEQFKKTAEAIDDSIGNTIADKITSVSKRSPRELQNDEREAGSASPKDVPKKRYISPEERQQIINELRLV